MRSQHVAGRLVMPVLVSKPRIPARGLKHLPIGSQLVAMHRLHSGIKATNPRSGTETSSRCRVEPTAVPVQSTYQSHESPLGD